MEFAELKFMAMGDVVPQVICLSDTPFICEMLCALGEFSTELNCMNMKYGLRTAEFCCWVCWSSTQLHGDICIIKVYCTFSLNSVSLKYNLRWSMLYYYDMIAMIKFKPMNSFIPFVVVLYCAYMRCTRHIKRSPSFQNESSGKA